MCARGLGGALALSINTSAKPTHIQKQGEGANIEESHCTHGTHTKATERGEASAKKDKT